MRGGMVTGMATRASFGQTINVYRGMAAISMKMQETRSVSMSDGTGGKSG